MNHALVEDPLQLMRQSARKIADRTDREAKWAIYVAECAQKLSSPDDSHTPPWPAGQQAFEITGENFLADLLSLCQAKSKDLPAAIRHVIKTESRREIIARKIVTHVHDFACGTGGINASEATFASPSAGKLILEVSRDIARQHRVSTAVVATLVSATFILAQSLGIEEFCAHVRAQLNFHSMRTLMLGEAKRPRAA